MQLHSQFSRSKASIRSFKRMKKSQPFIILMFFLAIVLIGDIVGAIMFIRQDPHTRQLLVEYFQAGQPGDVNFFQVYWDQTMVQLSIWAYGLTLIGNFANAFLVFTRGITAGFNLAFMIYIGQGFRSFLGLLLWSVQYLFVLFTTVLSAYFSLRFGLITIKCLIKKRPALIKRHFRLYVSQLAFVLVLTIFTSLFTAFTTPRINEMLYAPLTRTVSQQLPASSGEVYFTVDE